jgi:hypothetical protein
MAENAKHNYDESKIKTLSSLEHISSVTAEPTRGWDEKATTTKIVFV